MSAPNLVTICAEDEGNRYVLHMKADEFMRMDELKALHAISITGRFDEVKDDVEFKIRFKLISEGLLEARKALLSQK